MNNALKYALIASLGGFLFGFETAVISGAEKTIQQLWSLSSFLQGFTVSVSLLGTILGALTASAPAQRFGRKQVLIVIAVLYLISAIGCALSYSWLAFVLFRFLGGLAVGVSSVVGPIYISEIAPANKRGRMTGFFQLMIVTGIFTAYLTNFLFVGLGEDSWRWMLGIMAIPAIAFLILLQFIPSSPRWLLLKNRKSDAMAVFQKLGDQEGYELAKGDSVIAQKNEEKLFQRKYYKPIIYVVLLAMFNQLCGINAILYYAPRIFEMAGFSQQLAYLQPVFIGGANLLFTMIAMLIIDRFGRKKMLLTGAVGMFIFLALAASAFYQNQPASASYLLFYIIGFIAFFAFSQGAVIWVFIAEIFPNSVRSKGSSLGGSTHWIMAALVSWCFPVIVEELANGAFYAFVFYSVMVVLSFIFILQLPETKGKTLEQIQKDLES